MSAAVSASIGCTGRKSWKLETRGGRPPAERGAGDWCGGAGHASRAADGSAGEPRPAPSPRRDTASSAPWRSRRRGAERGSPARRRSPAEANGRHRSQSAGNRAPGRRCDPAERIVDLAEVENGNRHRPAGMASRIAEPPMPMRPCRSSPDRKAMTMSISSGFTRRSSSASRRIFASRALAAVTAGACAARRAREEASRPSASYRV